MNKPKKLIRSGITSKLKEGEWETVTDQDELNRLYAIKIREELAEIQSSEHKDIFEFVDLIQVAYSFAVENGFSVDEITDAITTKSHDKGSFGRLALNNLNPANPSNKLYFEGTTGIDRPTREPEAPSNLVRQPKRWFSDIKTILHRCSCEEGNPVEVKICLNCDGII